MWRIINKIRRFFRVAWFKTLFFNFYMLPFRDAVKVPILLTRNVYLFSLQGRLELMEPSRFGMIRFGFLNEDFVVAKKCGINLCLDGILRLGKNNRIAPGVTIRIYSDGILTLRNNVAVGFNTKFFCMKEIVVDSDTRIGFEGIITDTTFHYMRNIETKKLYELTSAVHIGSHNWIGARSYIMKGCRLPDYTIVSAGSFCNKKYDFPKYCLIAGAPAQLKREKIYRCLDDEEDEIKKILNC